LRSAKQTCGTVAAAVTAALTAGAIAAAASAAHPMLLKSRDGGREYDFIVELSYAVTL
jgi:hypothetical protein